MGETTPLPAAGGGGGGGAGGATTGVSSYLASWMVPVVNNGAMISVARITMCKPVAAAHWRGLLRAVLVVAVSSNAFRKTSVCVVGDRPTSRAVFVARSFVARSYSSMGMAGISPPLLFQLIYDI